MLGVQLLDANGNPVEGAPVDWSASAGVFETSYSRSNSKGLAYKRWTAPGETGAITVTVSAGDASPMQFMVQVVPGAVTTLRIIEDSVRFTSQLQSRVIRMVGTDAFGHASAIGADQPVFQSPAATVVAQTPVGDTLFVELKSGYGTHTGYTHAISSNGVARDSVFVDATPVVTRIDSIGGLDPANGLAVGEKAQLTVTGADSLGHPIVNVDLATAGLQLSSSDPQVATASSDGGVTAVAPGTVTIDASAGGTAYHVPLTVYPVFDIGTRISQVALHDLQAYSQTPHGSYLTDAGTLYDLSHYIGAGALPHPEAEVLRATAAGGKVSWTRSYSMSYATAVADPAAGIVYVAADSQHVVHAIDPAGTDRWSFDYGTIDTGRCLLAGWQDGVAAACTTHVFALKGDGSRAWSATVSDTLRQIITSPTQVILRTKGSVTAISGDGSVAWTMTSGAADMIADASSNVYLVENGVRAIDASGVERWHNATSLAGCIIATADRLVVCRNNRVVTALDPADGHVRWTVTSPATFGSMAAISGDRILLSYSFIFALDARSGVVLGRSLNRIDEPYMAVGNGVMAVTSFSDALVFRTSFAPGSEWSQGSGNAGHGNRVTP